MTHCFPQSVKGTGKLCNSLKKLSPRFTLFRLRCNEKVSFCPQCEVISPQERCLNHSHKPLWTSLTREEYLNPTKWINAKTNNKINAVGFTVYHE